MERRAIDEVRRTRPDQLAELPENSKSAVGAVEPDFAAQLDDLDRIRRWRSGIRLRLSRRERQAAVLHFIQGFSRIETAEMLGVPPRRADKIFDSITSKTSGLLAAIDDGTWCEGERSLMVAFSAGVLDPGGERYAIALQHVSECPGCAAFVRRQRNAYLIVPAPALAGVATAAGGGALGAALGLAEVTSTGAGAGVTAGGAGLLGGLSAKTAVMCASAVCLTGAGAGVAVVESVRHPSKPAPARAARAPKQAAAQEQQENELGIEPGGSTPPAGSSASSWSGTTSDSSTSAPSASSASTGSSTGGGTASASPPANDPPKTTAPRGGSSGGQGTTESGIEP
jgi:hypothetical protein